MSQTNICTKGSDIPSVLIGHRRDLVILDCKGFNIEIDTPPYAFGHVRINQYNGNDIDTIIIHADDIDNLIRVFEEYKKKIGVVN